MMCPQPNTTRCRRRTIGTAVLLGVVACAAIAGCQNAPITEDDERSPYDRYDRIRDEYAAPYLQDEYGRKRPNLRGRLIDRR